MASPIEVEAFDDPLTAVRRVVDGADEALFGVAFVQHRGVNLLENEFKPVARARLITTTAFGLTTAQGLAAAQNLGLEVRVLNPSRGTFHPKLYVARHGDTTVAAVSSANLTSGLVANVEAGAILRGPGSARPLLRLWELAQSWWEHVDAVAWSPERVAAAPEVLAPDLLVAIMAALSTDRVVRTIADGKENWVRDITPDGVRVETHKSRAQKRPPQLVEAWMIPDRVGLARSPQADHRQVPCRGRRAERQALELRLRPPRAPSQRRDRLASADQLRLRQARP